MIKKVKNILTLIALSLIIVLNGCGSKVKTTPWSERDIEKMNDTGQETVPLIKLEF